MSDITYDDIRSVYDAIIIDHDAFPDAIDNFRSGLARLVDKLITAHSKGIVESIEGLPTQQEILKYDKTNCQRLVVEVLMEKYFPNMPDKNDQRIERIQ